MRESLRRVDPDGGVSRFATVLHRRVYAVHSPNALWHIDGYHKLIRWKFVIHGGIEPISRHQPTTVQLPFCLHSRMLYKSMVSLMSENGCRWGECLVSHYMTEMRGIGCNSAMVGRSVHK